MKVVDSFLIASGARKVVLLEMDHNMQPWRIQVLVKNKARGRIGQEWKLLSESVYKTEGEARHAFETRRPRMRDDADANSMYGRGKRMVQEVMTEVLGPLEK